MRALLTMALIALVLTFTLPPTAVSRGRDRAPGAQPGLSQAVVLGTGTCTAAGADARVTLQIGGSDGTPEGSLGLSGTGLRATGLYFSMSCEQAELAVFDSAPEPCTVSIDRTTSRFDIRCLGDADDVVLAIAEIIRALPPAK